MIPSFCAALLIVANDMPKTGSQGIVCFKMWVLGTWQMTSAEKPALRFLNFNDSENGVLAYCLGNGKLVDSDVYPIWDVFDSAKKIGNKIRIYCEINSIPSVSATVIFDRFKRLGTLLSTSERMAIVGDQTWLDFYARIVNPIIGFEVRSFASGDAGSAKQ